MKISILDQAPYSQGQTPQTALENMRESAVLADKLGYHRFWIAEHHNSELASSAPEISIAHFAALTKNIRLGSGGTMMMHYSPYKMAEVFKTLSAYAPGRIDFGAGRAPGGDGRSILALSEGRNTMHQDLYDKLQETMHFLEDKDSDNPLYRHVTAQPKYVELAQPWMLGSTGNSAAKAGEMGVGYAYVQFFNGTIDPDIFNIYRKNFRPSSFFQSPHVLVCYFITVAETDEEAAYEALPADISHLYLMTNRKLERLSPAAAAHFPLSPAEKDYIRQSNSWHVRGSIQRVKEFLLREKEINGFDELMICTIPYSQEFKLKEYKLIAKHLIDV
ncbi:MAG: MsnO8 family LLM class oxidoreductase [Paludibacteraceae bacterium]